MKDLFGNEEIRALWWKQPFGSLMLHGKIETRKWPTKYRGLVLICTSKEPYSDDKMDLICEEDWLYRIFQVLKQDPSARIKGHAIAIGRLVESRPVLHTDKTFVKNRPELFAHVYQDVKRIEPFSLKGSQGWRKVTDEVRSKIVLKSQH